MREASAFVAPIDEPDDWAWTLLEASVAVPMRLTPPTRSDANVLRTVRLGLGIEWGRMGGACGRGGALRVGLGAPKIVY